MASQISMTTPSPAGPANGNPPPIPPEELIAGIQLLRAANLQTVRLQLAMFRQERRSAMESLDRLAEMDRELERFLAGLEPAAPALDEINRLVTAQKSALADEKIALMAEISGPKVAAKADRARALPCPADAPPNPAIPAPEPPAETEAAPPKIMIASEDGVIAGPAVDEDRAGRRRGMAIVLLLLAILAVGSGGGAWLAFTQPEQAAALSRQAAAMGQQAVAAMVDLLARLPLP